MKGQPALSLTADVRLRRWSVHDAPALLTALRDPLVRHYSGYLLDDVAHARNTVQRYDALWARAEGAAWAVSDRAGTVLGAVRFGLIDQRLGTGSVGYWLLPEARGRGVAVLAVRRSTRLVFDALHWHRIELYHAVENERSCRVARRSGYRFEGIMRDGMRYPVDERWSDEHLHARLESDPDPRPDPR